MKSLSKEYPVNLVVPKGSTLGLIVFLLYANNLLDDVICNIAIYADDTTLYKTGAGSGLLILMLVSLNSLHLEGLIALLQK